MRFFNRELSWLSFNERILQEAGDKSVPLFERLKFLAIFSSNLEEFFRVRVASLRTLLNLKSKTVKDLDFDPAKVLKEIHKKVDTLQTKFGEVFRNDLLQELKQKGIFLKNESELSDDEQYFVREFFNERLRPHINPMIIIKKKLTPFLKSGVLYMAIKLTSKSSKMDESKKRFSYALVEIPTDKISRFLILPSKVNETKMILLDDVIRFCIDKIFEGFNIEEVRSIKLTRDAELYIDDEYSGNLIEKIKKSINKRNIGAPSRFLYDEEISKELLHFFRESLDLCKEDLMPGGRYHNFSDFFEFPHPYIEGTEYAKLVPIVNTQLKSCQNIFQLISTKDFLLHFPYESFQHVIDFIEAASSDEHVHEIKITLYRAARNSQIIKHLVSALGNGKKVTIFIEVKARFDEELNLEYARYLEDAGAKILFSMPGIKVHAKSCLVTRRENGMTNKYCYLSTGNFNEKTANIYSDFGYFTANEKLTNEVAKVFDILEGNSDSHNFTELLVAPLTMKKNFISLIENEINYAGQDVHAEITVKLNSLEDTKMIERLYEAANKGVKVNLIVRGVCCLIPGLKGLSENINAISIVDRFLEHSRVFIFHNGGDEKVFLSSADWMKRNLNRRIEIAFPILDEELKKKIKDILQIQIDDDSKSRIINSEQNNVYKVRKSEGDICRAQTETYEYLKTY